MEIKVVCTEKLLVYLAHVNHCAVAHKTPFRLAGAPLTAQWLPSITFVKGEKMTKFMLINKSLYIAYLRQECHNSKFDIFELLV